jgi:hypothetical protein
LTNGGQVDFAKASAPQRRQVHVEGLARRGEIQTVLVALPGARADHRKVELFGFEATWCRRDGRRQVGFFPGQLHAQITKVGELL